ncbi:MAG: hypothetical protein ACR2JB_08665 [Bryobacteraceae bacterium]
MDCQCPNLVRGQVLVVVVDLGRAAVAVAAVNPAARGRAAAANLVRPGNPEVASLAVPAKEVRRVNPAHRASRVCLGNLTRPVNPARLVVNIDTRKIRRTQAIQTQRRVRAALLHSSLLP